ncbi:MAG: beta-ketoacyl synthase N-terminal-like domain-containing protein, partial [Desulfosarcinaceae bacterium]
MDDIVITGIGIVSAMGVGRQAFWQSCLAAESGIKPIAGRLEGDFQSPLAGLVTDYDPRLYLKPATYRRMSRASRMAASACVEAVRDSGLDPIQGDTSRMAIVAGTAHGSSMSVEDFYLSLLEDGPRGAKPFCFPETVPNAPAGNIAMVLGITGPNTTFGHNDLSAETALVFALRLLEEGRVDLAIVCGLDEINAMFFGCLDALNALNPGEAARETNGLRPKPGAGIVLGEGAGALVLERSKTAAAREAQVYAALDAGALTGGKTGIGRYDHLEEALQRA